MAVKLRAKIVMGAGHKFRSRLLDEIVDLKRLEEKNFEFDTASFWRLYSAAMWKRASSISSLSWPVAMWLVLD